ncbi:MAG: transporter substrate-binding domain-containing protein [Bacteroidales bacterium]
MTIVLGAFLATIPYPASSVITERTLPFQENVAKKILSASEPDYPPYCIVDSDGNPDGFSVELFTAAARAAGLEVEMKIGIWSQIRNDLEEGRIDALPLVGRTPERENLYDFTMPYLTLHGAAFIRKRNRGEISTMEDLRGKSIIVMEGDNAEEYVRRINLSDNIILTHTFHEAFQLLAAGDHDAVITQRVLGENILKELKIKSIEPLDILNPRLRQDFCFAVNKGNTELLSRLNEGLSIVIANKTYDNLRLKWFGPADGYKVTPGQVLRVSLYFLLPLLVTSGILMILFLQSEVKRRTSQLTGEIEEHKKTEEELTILKDELEAIIEEKTKNLNEQVQKLNRSQKAMLYMVEDLNETTGELREERRKLELINKELEAFSYSVAHDLRAPLRAIDGFSNMMMEDYGHLLDSEGNRLLIVLRENSQKMDRLITDLLSLSRVTRTEMSAVSIDMAGLAKGIFHEIASNDELKRVKFKVGKLPEAFGDPTLIKQVWSNLISNALKYTRPKQERRIEISGARDEGYDRYIISDNGVGFNQEYADKIFETFHRLHRTEEFEGTGIGLSIVLHVVKRHGGTVGAEGEEGTGAKVWFTLPSANHE